MNRIRVTSKVSSEGVLHLDLPLGMTEANKEVQVTVEPIPPASADPLPTMTAYDLLHSGLVGMWADRKDIGDSREFARRLRQQAQTRRQDP
jgi:hypothetical protein